MVFVRSRGIEVCVRNRNGAQPAGLVRAEMVYGVRRPAGRHDRIRHTAFPAQRRAPPYTASRRRKKQSMSSSEASAAAGGGLRTAASRLLRRGRRERTCPRHAAPRSSIRAPPRRPAREEDRARRERLPFPAPSPARRSVRASAPVWERAWGRSSVLSPPVRMRQAPARRRNSPKEAAQRGRRARRQRFIFTVPLCRAEW